MNKPPLVIPSTLNIWSDKEISAIMSNYARALHAQAPEIYCGVNVVRDVIRAVVLAHPIGQTAPEFIVGQLAGAAASWIRYEYPQLDKEIQAEG